ncbi:MAG: HNH endonuclease [Alcanivoracaceae bacterium]|nr:HNH endonuclease [Alcanivoracaceae bacterium]
MRFDTKTKRTIYDRTRGYCHLCNKKLAFKNYGKSEGRAAWEIDHSNPKANGGTDRLNNLYAACISCNRSKKHSSTRTARAQNGRTRAPLSAEKRQKAVRGNTLVGALVGLLGGAVLGPAAAVAGAGIGAAVGKAIDPDG